MEWGFKRGNIIRGDRKRKYLQRHFLLPDLQIVLTLEIFILALINLVVLIDILIIVIRLLYIKRIVLDILN